MARRGYAHGAGAHGAAPGSAYASSVLSAYKASAYTDSSRQLFLSRTTAATASTAAVTDYDTTGASLSSGSAFDGRCDAWHGDSGLLVGRVYGTGASCTSGAAAGSYASADAGASGCFYAAFGFLGVGSWRIVVVASCGSGGSSSSFPAFKFYAGSYDFG